LRRREEHDESAPVPTGYPFDLADDDLAGALRNMFETPRAWVDFDALLPELQLGIIEAGLQEQSRRETEALRTMTADATAAANRSATWSVRIAAVAVLIALASLIVQLLT
jgi:hypothetical protein